MKSIFSIPVLFGLLFFSACQTTDSHQTADATESATDVEISSDPGEWSKNLSIYEVNIRQFTPEGTFKAFEAHLPRLKDLGVGILWFMPINPIGEKNRKGSLGSYYSIQDYEAINPEFGSLEDFKHLVNQIHKMGMYAIIDWVPNHTAWDHPWTETHPEYYHKGEDGNFRPPVPDWADVIHLNYDNMEMRQAMIDAMKFWLRECDIDGFRCDVAHMIPTDFWTETRKQLDEVKPVFMLAEAEIAEQHPAFHMSYAWKLHHLLNELAQAEKNASDLEAYWEWEKNEFPADAYRMVFTSNHDENSWNGTVQERMGDAAETLAVLTYTIPGMPLIYSGQEAGLDKRLAFFEKDSIEWKEHRMQGIYQRLNQLKRDNPALWNGTHGGDFIRIPTDNEGIMYAFMRQKENHKVLAIFNMSDVEQEFQLLDSTHEGVYENPFNGQQVRFAMGQVNPIEPWGYGVLVAK